MSQEIERKYLVKNGDFKKQSFKKINIVQGFLSSVPERTVRIRISEQKAFLTVKGIGNKSGISRFEWEKGISIKDAKSLIKLCEPGIISKIRYNVKSGNHIIEIDEFQENNKGLIIAEIELKSESENFKKPSWLGQEVTGVVKYYNSMLSIKPFKTW